MKAAAPSNGAESKKDDVSGAMLEPSVVNTSWVRSLATIGAVCLAAASTGSMPAKWAALVHVLAFGTWLGTMFWNTFFVGITMFKLVPRQMFGRVQSVLFPRYFALTTGANILLLGSLLMVPAGLAARISAQAVPVLSVALVASVINWLGVEPIATKLMFQRYDLENLTEKNDEVKDKIKVLYKEFGKWHGISSLLNLVIFCCALAHAWYLGAILAL